MRTDLPRWLGHLALLGCAACATRDVAPVATVDAVLPESAYRALPLLAWTDVRPACAAVGADVCSVGVAEATVGPMGVIAFWGVDGKRTQLYRIDTAGNPIRLSRVGGGPGEYRFAAPLGFDAQGNVAIVDLPQRRLTRFDADGAVVAIEGLPYPLGLFHVGFADGSPVAIATDLPSTKGDSMSVHEYLLDVSRREPVRRRRLGFTRPAYAVSDMRPVPPAFASHDHFVHLADGTLLHSPGDRFLIDAYEPASNGIRRFGFDVASRAATDAELDEVKRRALARVGDARMRAAMEASLRDAGRSARHPAITRLVVLGTRGIAVRQAPRADGDSAMWVLFDSLEAPSGRLMLGVEDRILGAFRGRILIAFDEDGTLPGLHWVRIDPLTQPPSR